MDTSSYVGSGSALGSLLRNADLLGGMLASFFVWLANTRPDRFEELAQAFEDFRRAIEFEESGGEVVEPGTAERDTWQ